MFSGIINLLRKNKNLACNRLIKESIIVNKGVVAQWNYMIFYLYYQFMKQKMK